MPNHSELLERLGVPADVISAFEADEMPENIDDLIGKAKGGLVANLKTSQDYKDAIKRETDAQFKRTQIKFMKDYNREFDTKFTNAEIESFASFTDFIEAAKERHTPTPSGDDKLKEEVTSLKTRIKDILKERDDYAEKLMEAETAKEQAVKDATDKLQAETYYMNLVQSDKELIGLEVPGKDKILQAVKTEIFGNAKVMPDGTIQKPDGTPFEVNGKVVSKVDDLFKVTKEAYGLVKRSNAGTGNPAPAGAGQGGAGGVNIDDTPEMIHMRQQLENARRTT